MTLTESKRLVIKGRALLPIVQGGMGVGVSGHRLAGAVARQGAFGTIASVDLRRLHPDLMADTERSRDKDRINAANLVALDREIKAALAEAQGKGLIGVNIMRAVSQYADYVRQACASGCGAIVMGAGLPLDLPDLTADHPEVALIPILSDVRGVTLVVRKWMRKQRLPDAIVIEHPRYAGGHLGAADENDVMSARFDFETVIPGVIAALRDLGVAPIPIIAAGGINSHEKVRRLLDMGASAVQLGTAFAVTEEGDAHPVFKKVLAEAAPEDIVTFMSVAGLPARAVRTPWLDRYLRREGRMKDKAKPRTQCTLAWDCLLSCGLRDGLARAGQFCIDNQLAAAVKGDLERGLFFRGSERLPFGSVIGRVEDLIRYLLSGEYPRGVQPATA